QRRWIFHVVRNNSRELAALQQLASLAAPAGHLVLRGADRLLAAAARLHTQQVAIAARGDEAEHAVVFAGQLDENHAFAWTGEVVHLIGAAEEPTRIRRGDDDHLLARHAGNSDDLDALARSREAAARTSARFDERLEAEPEAVAVARDRDRVHGRRHTFLLRRDVAGHARIQAVGRDNPLAVAQLEQLLHRLAVAGGRGHVDDARRVRRAEVAEQHDGGARAPLHDGEHRVAFTQARRRQVAHFLLPLHPSIARDDDDIVFLDDEIVGGEGDLLLRLDQRAALVVFAAVRLRHLLDLVADHLP